MNEALKPYLARSFGLHVAALAAFLLISPHTKAKPSSVYMIDFVGPSATIVSAGPAAPQAPAPKAPGSTGVVPPQTDADAIGRRHGPTPLPTPSLLAGDHHDRRPASIPSMSSSLAGQASLFPATTEATKEAGTSASGPAGAGVSTDLPNFPYPWYISQVRQMLWEAWQNRMPDFDAEGAVEFSILPDGSFTDLQVESSSGDADFDRAALASVQAAAPFPALPRDFHEPFLKIHLTLKSQASWR